ncbi:MAG: trimeric intracellular cation channel family protein [Clostridia bacterium]|nr:trimeric intracellular cation channel family protein [Clostridia bacterium]
MDVDTLIYVIELIGVISFAISGAVVGIDKEMDMFGVLILSLFTSFGGGMMRDLFIGRDVAFFGILFEKHYVLLCAVTSLLVFFAAMIFKRWYVKHEKAVMRVNNYIDALGIGAFSVSTVRTCILYGGNVASPFFAITMGVVASVGGGLLRDVCMRDIPFFFRKHIYAVACLVGSSFYYVMVMYAFPNNPTAEIVCAIVGILMVFGIRVLATIFRWNFPKAIDFGKLRDQDSAASESEAQALPETDEIASSEQVQEYVQNK